MATLRYATPGRWRKLVSGKLRLIVVCVGLGALTLIGFYAYAMGTRVSPRMPHSLPIPYLPSTPEALLVKSLLEIRNNRLDTALSDIEALLRIKPNFKLAYLIKGDLLLARSQAISTIGNAPGAPKENMADLRDEARARLQRYMEQPPSGLIPKYVLQFQPEQKYAIVVDKSKSRLYLFENQQGEPRYVSDYYITSGKNGAEKTREGDQKTPVGVYFVTSELAKSQLTDFYGPGAFPLSYPNEWDKRLGRAGHGIWLHGTPSDTYSRPPRASNGCVVLTNPDLAALSKLLQVGLTPVIISDKAEWLDPQAWRTERDGLTRQFEQWRRDWEGRNVDSYLSHYSKSFSGSGQSLASWASQKRQVNAAKSWIKVGLTQVSMFRYPGQDNMAVVTFEQDYQSNNLSNRMRKRQYWVLENKQWKIVYEGAA
jgi:murein L,D-transpeptidase YafK